MARGDFTPREIDSYFFLDILLIFLMINYQLPLGTIYAMMVVVGSLMYYVGLDQRLFKFIPILKSNKQQNLIVASLIGLAAGWGFVYFYNNILTGTAPMAQVFATTAFGTSESVGILVLGILIPIAETRFFFRTIMQWYAWKTNSNVKDVTSGGALTMIGIFAAIFTLFHATAKGLDNNIDLIATFIFGAISVAMVIGFQQVWEAAAMHIYVNSEAVGLIDFIIQGGLFTTPVLIIGGITLVIFLLSKNRNFKIPFLS